MEIIMNNKNTIIFWLTIANLALFIISFFKLIIGDSSDAGQNYGFGISVIAGIVLAVITIIQMFKQYKNYKDKQTLVPFFIACFKKENGKPMFQLLIALIINALPLVIVVGFLMLGASNGKVANNSNNLRSNTAKPLTNNNNGHNIEPNNLSYQELNHIAGNTDNNMKQIIEPKHNEIINHVKNNPGISDEDLAKQTGVDIETARAHRPPLNMSFQELNHKAGNTDNNMQQIIEEKHNEIKKIVRNNPGISNEELAKRVGVNVETARAHRLV